MTELDVVIALPKPTSDARTPGTGRVAASASSGSLPNVRKEMMKALVYRGPGLKGLKDCPKPTIQAPGDAIVKILKTTICGTDLHILKGDVATCAPGRILGHEGVGIIDYVGAGVTAFRHGDRVLISCISSCGKCDYCRRGMYSLFVSATKASPAS